MSIDTHILEFDMYCDLSRKKHMSNDTLEIEMTRIIGQLEYYKLQLKYMEKITHNNRRISYSHYMFKFSFALAISFLIGS